jgi:hypothetical protein
MKLPFKNWFLRLVKKIQLERRKTTETDLYKKQKNYKVLLASGKKIKVRQYIALLAHKLSRVNTASYEANRSILIKAYNGGDAYNGLKRVTDDYNYILNELRSQFKKQDNANNK